MACRRCIGTRSSFSKMMYATAYLCCLSCPLEDSYAIVAQAYGCMDAQAWVLPDEAIHGPLRGACNGGDAFEGDWSAKAPACNACNLHTMSCSVHNACSAFYTLQGVR